MHIHCHTTSTFMYRNMLYTSHPIMSPKISLPQHTVETRNVDYRLAVKRVKQKNVMSKKGKKVSHFRFPFLFVQRNRFFQLERDRVISSLSSTPLSLAPPAKFWVRMFSPLDSLLLSLRRSVCLP